MKVESFGGPDYGLFLIEVAGLSRIPVPDELAGNTFGCFLALDAGTVKSEAIAECAISLFANGAVRFDVWGPDCDRAQRIIHEAIVSRYPAKVLVEQEFTTSWHPGEPLEDSLYLAIYPPAEGEPYSPQLWPLLAIVHTNPDWTQQIAAWMKAPEKLREKVLSKYGN